MRSLAATSEFEITAFAENQAVISLLGMDKDDIDVTLSKERLTVRGEKGEEKVRRNRDTHHWRRSRSAFRRSILLPCQIDADEAEA